MTVLHQVGRLDVQGDQILNSMSGTRGLFRKEVWERNEAIPITDLSEVRVLEQLDGSISLALLRRPEPTVPFRKPASDNEVPQGFTHCRPPEAVESFLREVYGVNPQISIEWANVSGDLAAAPAIRVKTYSSPDEYQRDARTMTASGWRVEDQAALAGHINVRRTTARVLLGGFLIGGASRSKDKVIVTWVKDKGTASAPRATAEVISQEPGADSREDIPHKLRELAELRDAGVIMQEDFDAKKAELLKRM